LCTQISSVITEELPVFNFCIARFSLSLKKKLKKKLWVLPQKSFKYSKSSIFCCLERATLTSLSIDVRFTIGNQKLWENFRLRYLQFLGLRAQQKLRRALRDSPSARRDLHVNLLYVLYFLLTVSLLDQTYTTWD